MTIPKVIIDPLSINIGLIDIKAKTIIIFEIGVISNISFQRGYLPVKYVNNLGGLDVAW